MARTKLSCCGAWGPSRCKCSSDQKKVKKTLQKPSSTAKPNTAESERLSLEIELQQLKVQRLQLEEKEWTSKQSSKRRARFLSLLRPTGPVSEDGVLRVLGTVTRVAATLRNRTGQTSPGRTTQTRGSRQASALTIVAANGCAVK